MLVSAAQERVGGRSRRRVVILVDDDDDLRDSFEQALERDGYLVLPARDGAEALARMRGLTLPAVAVTDLLMPGLDGWRLALAMRADPALASIPILVVSVREAPVPGADRVLGKPCAPELLLHAVAELFRRG